MKDYELAELKKDAERYRYLRDTQGNVCREWIGDNDDMVRVGVVDHIFICIEYGVSEAVEGEDFDSYIDSAMLLFPKVFNG
jgi:hypothetical protein